ncbi:MAG: hypothetical protein ABIQ97_01320 [Lysobacteraceae bacterium]
MKTTIDIADDLIGRAKLIQKRDAVTLRALVEEGLRLVLDRDSRKSNYKYTPVVVGEPGTSSLTDDELNRLIAQSNDREWMHREYQFASVAECESVYEPKRSPAKKRKS